MKNKQYRVRLLLCLLTPFSLLVSYLLMSFPGFIEKYYSGGINKLIIQALSRISSILPFSIAELIIVSSFLFIFYVIINFIYNIITKHNKRSVAARFLINTVALLSVVYFLFIFLWGMNYYRQPFSKMIGLHSTSSSVKELTSMCSSLIEKANALSVDGNATSLTTKPKNNPSLTVQDKYSKQSILKQVNNNYKNAVKFCKALDGSYGNPKGLKASFALSYAGISGVYFPFTGEANVNSDIPLFMIPNTACHEAAHQRGFAREDEANYISYFVCSKSPDAYFRYSGTILAMLYSMDALYQYDISSYKHLKSKYSKQIQHDLAELNAFWKRYEGPIDKLSTKINNAYLKANRQKDGIYSYGRMVDLLLAEFKAKQQ